MSDTESHIVIKTHLPDTMYLALPGHRCELGIVKRTVRVRDVVAGSKGPDVNLDFDKEGRLIGIEVLVYESDKV